MAKSKKTVAAPAPAPVAAPKRSGRAPEKTTRVIEFLKSKASVGLTVKAIAEQLGVSVSTVSNARKTLAA